MDVGHEENLNHIGEASYSVSESDVLKFRLSSSFMFVGWSSNSVACLQNWFME